MEKQKKRLTRAQRVVLGATSVIVLTLAILVYFDFRLCLLGDAAWGPDLLLTVLVVVSVLLGLSAVLGQLVGYGSMNFLEMPNADPDAALVVPSTDADFAENDQTGKAIPDCPKNFREQDLVEVDSDFLKALREFYVAEYGERLKSKNLLKACVPSGRGRRYYYFRVVTPQGEQVWIKVPHVGAAGRGAGSASHQERV